MKQAYSRWTLRKYNCAWSDRNSDYAETKTELLCPSKPREYISVLSIAGIIQILTCCFGLFALTHAQTYFVDNGLNSAFSVRFQRNTYYLFWCASIMKSSIYTMGRNNSWLKSPKSLKYLFSRKNLVFDVFGIFIQIFIHHLQGTILNSPSWIEKIFLKLTVDP